MRIARRRSHGQTSEKEWYERLSEQQNGKRGKNPETKKLQLERDTIGKKMPKCYEHLSEQQDRNCGKKPELKHLQESEESTRF